MVARRTVLHQFDVTESAFPVAELVEIDDGSLYGTTEGGFFFFQILGS